MSESGQPPSARISRRVVRDIYRFLQSFDPSLDNVSPERQPVAHVLWGWWMWLTEQSMFVVRVSNRPAGLVMFPVVRSVGEHADLMLWLSDAGLDGVMPLHVSKQKHQQNLWDAYVASEGHPPGGLDRMPDTYSLRSASEEEAYSRQESVEQRAASFEGVPYYVFRAVSDLVHAGLATSRVYAPVEDDGTGRMLNVPNPTELHGWPDTALADCAVRCCQAALIFAREISDPQFSTQANAWCARLGVPPVLPARRAKERRSYTSEMVAQAARESREAMRLAQPVVEGLASGSPSAEDTARAYRSLRRLKSASTDVQRLVVREKPNG